MKKLMLGLFLIVGSVGGAHEPKVITTIAEKSKATDLFLKNEKVRAAIQALEDSGYKQLSVDALPYQFFFTDEGPASWYLVTAYLGKAEQYGWAAKFVTARVNTDNFGALGAVLLDSEKLANALNELK